LPVELHETSATLTGVVTVDDVEPLTAWLRVTARARVNLRGCTHLHTGALQALLCFHPKVSAAPTDAFLASQVLPLLTVRSGASDRPGSRSP
jgi:hypothetical protein